MPDGGNVAIRFSVKDAEAVRLALTNLGKDGEAALRKFEAAGQQSSRGLNAVSVVMNDLKGQANSMATSTGLAGSALLALGPVGTVAAVALGTVALGLVAVGERVKNLRELASAHKEGAATTRLSVAEFQAFIAITEKHGGTADEAAAAVTRLNLAHAQAVDGAGDLYKILRQVNPQLAEEFAASKRTADQIDILNRARGQATRSERELLERQLGRGGARLGTTFDEIAAGGGLEKTAEGLLKIKRIIAPGVVDALDEANKRSKEKTVEIKNNWDAVALSIDGARRRFIEWLGVSKENSERGLISRMARQATEFLSGSAGDEVAALERLIARRDEARAKFEHAADELRKHGDRFQNTGDQEAGDLAARWERRADAAAKNLQKLNSEIEKLEKKSTPPTELGRAATNIGTITPLVSSLDAERERLKRSIEAQKEYLAARGETSTAEERFALRQDQTRLGQLQKRPILSDDPGCPS